MVQYYSIATNQRREVSAPSFVTFRLVSSSSDNKLFLRHHDARSLTSYAQDIAVVSQHRVQSTRRPRQSQRRRRRWRAAPNLRASCLAPATPSITGNPLCGRPCPIATPPPLCGSGMRSTPTTFIPRNPFGAAGDRAKRRRRC